MTGTLFQVVSAASESSVFSLEDCRQLDFEIRRTAKKAAPFNRLSDADLQRLCSDLNCIASGRLAQGALGERRTARERLLWLQAVEKKSLNIVHLLGVQPHSSPSEVPIEHLLDDGIFEDPTIDYVSLVEGLRTLSRIAREKIDRMQISGIGSRESRLIPEDYRLYDDLAAVYMDRWGHGRLKASVNKDVGGPSIRFLVFTLERILQRAVEPQEAFDAVKKIRRGEVDLSSVYSVFSPNGGRRISGEKET